MEKIKLRMYKKGDEFALVEIYNKIFRDNLTLDYWEWKYGGPFKHLIVVASDKDGKIVGQYCNQGKNGIYFGNEYLFFNPCDICIDEEYRGQEFIGKAINFPKEPRFFGFGFPLKNSMHKYPRYGVSNEAISIPIFYKKLTYFPLRSLIRNKSYACEEIKELEIDNLWNSKKLEIEIGVKRDWEFFKWRIMENPRNIKSYLIKKKGKTIGYFSLFKKEGICFIVDILILNSYVNNQVVDLIEDKVYRLGLKEMKIMLSDLTLRKLFFNNGFNKIDYRLCFYYNKIDGRKIDSIYVTFVDSDEF